MTELVTDCPRCDAKEHTFLVLSIHPIGTIEEIYLSRKLKIYEAFCVCKRCLKSTIFKIIEKSSNAENDKGYFISARDLISYPNALNNIIQIGGYINIRNMASCPAPENIPEKRIEDVFREGAESVTGNCPNAAVAMFRLCIDLATKSLLLKLSGEVDDIPKHVEKSLKARLDWLLENNKLPEDLKELSHCIREDGNAGVHDGIITLDDAKDIMDFCSILLTRLYTDPARIEAAQRRQEDRRAEPQEGES